MRPEKPSRSVKRAKLFRRTLSKPEWLLWQILRTSPCGHKFRKQHPAGPYILDFFCAKANLGIEIDGYAHDTSQRPERDAARDAWFAKHKIDTLRIPAVDVLRDAVETADRIVAVIEERLTRFGKAPPSALRAATSPMQVIGKIELSARSPHRLAMGRWDRGAISEGPNKERKMTTVVLTSLLKPMIMPHLPDWVDARFYASVEEMHALAPEAEIGWFDMEYKPPMVEAIKRAEKLKWLNSIYAGLDHLPLDLLKDRKVQVTNGVGINAITIAEYVVMGMLTMAKGYRQVVRAQDRHEWLLDSPGKVELYGSKALLLGYGAIGKLVEERLKAFNVDVTVVRRTPGPNTLGPNDWRARLGEFDWILLAVPATPETDGMIGADELASMKPSARIVNVARGTVIDQQALTTALNEKKIAEAFLDVTEPEPLPADDPLWTLDNAHVTMHLSGRAQDKMFARSVERFLQNLHRYHAGQPLQPLVDLNLGY